jgi:hypothetical protein
MGWLFVIGSACFAVGVPLSLNTSLSPSVGAMVFFVGSIFFTSASSIQMKLAWRAGDLAASATTWQALAPGRVHGSSGSARCSST